MPAQDCWCSLTFVRNDLCVFFEKIGRICVCCSKTMIGYVCFFEKMIVYVFQRTHDRSCVFFPNKMIEYAGFFKSNDSICVFSSKAMIEYVCFFRIK